MRCNSLLCLLQVPSTEDEWREVARDFSELWNFPNCVGALDGKRVLIQAPKNSGSLYYDYKQQFSTVLLALVDARYRFLYIDVGAYGRQSDAGVFSNSILSDALAQNTVGFPTPEPLPGTTISAPYVVVSDDAFPMKTYMLKPYPGRLYDDYKSRVFNYRLSRARRVVENAFGIMASRWRVLRGRMSVCPDTANKVVLASCALHNYLMTPSEGSSNSTRVYCPEGTADTEDTQTGSVIDGSWRSDDASGDKWLDIRQQGNRGHTACAKQVRDLYRDYFAGTGNVPWQDNMI